jgi:hypothetical protein
LLPLLVREVLAGRKANEQHDKHKTQRHEKNHGIEPFKRPARK